VRRTLSVRRFLSAWLALSIFWIVLTDNSGWREILAGGFASAISVLAAAAFVRKGHVNIRLRWNFVKEAIHLAPQLASDTGVLLRTIARRMAGARANSGIVVVAFQRGGNRPSSRGRRALATTSLTVTPNTLVLGISEEKRILVFHAIVPRPLPEFIRRLGAEPERES
jgi:multisubunit Na+/H+ antiporter MnhE subunit